MMLPVPFSYGAQDFHRAVSSIAVACRHDLGISEALEMQSQILQRMQHVKVEPDTSMFNTVLSCGFHWENTLNLFDQMRKLHISQSESTYTSTLKACNWQIGLLIWQRLNAPTAPTPSIEIFDAKVCSSLISSLDAEWQWAVLLLHQLPEVDMVLCSACISACEKASEWQVAFVLFESTEKRDVVLYNAMISALEKSGQWIFALHLLDQMPLQSLLPDGITFSAAISACEKGLQWQKALSLLSLAMFSNHKIDAITLNSAISSVEKCGLWQIALILLHEMTQFSLADEVSFNAAISACEKGQGLLRKKREREREKRRGRTSET